MAQGRCPSLPGHSFRFDFESPLSRHTPGRNGWGLYYKRIRQEERTVDLAPSEVDIVSLRVPWPQGLSEIAAGTAVLVSLSTRADDAKGAVSVASRKAVIAAD